ncbi:MAG: SGNH/GDSL hydrolase family protein [Anaerolineae bacterium]|nr:SGNH/GDSL hydrolase family protein [Anaerolineae bacterium]
MTALDNSFKMVVLGDSVMWGQGVFEPQKMHTLVIEALTGRGLSVEPVFLAHSGAIIGEPDEPTNKPPIDGEVPVGEPTVFEQIQTALNGSERDEAAKLVLICAGVNDVDVTRILNLRDRGLDKYIKDTFYRKTKLLIERCYHCFPNAIIILCGYYQAFSEESEQKIMLDALKAMGFSVPLLPNSVGELVIEVLGEKITDTLVERCAHFRDSAHDCIREAILDTVRILPEAKERLFFADPKFKAENAVGASQPFLYGINSDLSPQDPPEIANRRAKACEVYADRLELLDQFTGPRASCAHPTPLGARQYADVIIANLRYAIPILFGDDKS